MRLNGWQRIYCVLSVLWLAYISFGTYKHIHELSENIENYERQIRLVVETSTERDERTDFLQAVISKAEDKKVSAIATAVFNGFIPPVLIYLVLIWIIAGFKVAEVPEP